MFGSVARRSVLPAFRVNRRMFSGHSAEEAKSEVDRWWKLTLGII